MAGFMAGLGLFSSIAGSIAGSRSKNKRIEAQNEALLLQWEQNKAATAEMLGTLDERTSRAEYEAVRASIRKKMDIQKAAHKAEGEATVRAAAIGAGEGKRARLATFRPAARIAGDLITEANINLQTELSNITEHFNDTASRAIANLNRNVPTLDSGISTGEMLLQAGAAGLNYYSQLSDTSQADLANIFSPLQESGVDYIDAPAGFGTGPDISGLA